MQPRRRLLLIGLLLLPFGCTEQQREQAESSAGGAGRQATQAIKKVTKDGGRIVTDAGITLKVKTAMSASDRLKSSGINVDTRDRVAYLKGTVTDSGQRSLAERIAKDTVGKDVIVVNRLKVGTSK